MKPEIFEHSGKTCPVPADTIVCYRTKRADGIVSHFWHHPHPAGFLNWKEGLAFGRIYEYFIVRGV